MAKVDWKPASDIKERIDFLIDNLDIKWLSKKNIFCFRSTKSNARAYARIWGLNQIWQLALKKEPAYAIEVLSEHFDKLDLKKRDEVLLHELAHIPMTFSGALKPHSHHVKGGFHDILGEFKKAYNTAKFIKN